MGRWAAQHSQAPSLNHLGPPVVLYVSQQFLLALPQKFRTQEQEPHRGHTPVWRTSWHCRTIPPPTCLAPSPRGHPSPGPGPGGQRQAGPQGQPGQLGAEHAGCLLPCPPGICKSPPSLWKGWSCQVGPGAGSQAGKKPGPTANGISGDR